MCLSEVFKCDPYNCHVFQNFLNQYGDVNFKRANGSMTSIKRELIQYPDLITLAQNADHILT